jgi:hypothetical protein
MPGPRTIALRQRVRKLLDRYDGDDRIAFIASELGVSRHAAACLIGKVWLENLARKMEALHEGGDLREGEHGWRPVDDGETSD